MPLPDALTTTVLSGTYTAPDGTPLGGQLTFTPSSALTNESGHPVLAATPLTVRLAPGTGSFSISLLNTDNALLPDTWMWHVIVAVPGAQESYFFGLPSTLGDATDINTLTPVSPPPSGASFVSSVNGQTGDVILADGFGILPPAGDLGGGTTLAPQVTATHLSAPLPVVQGGTGAASGSTALTALGAASASALAAEVSRAEAAEAGFVSSAALATETSRAETAEALLAPKASPALTGSPTAPTQTTGDATTKIATDAFVGTAVAAEATRATAAEALKQGVRTPTAVKTGTSYTAVAGDFAKIDSTAGAYTVTLPAAPADKTVIGVKLVASAATVNAVTITRGGSDTFNLPGGATTLTLKLLNQGCQLQYNSAAGVWDVHGDDLPLGGLDTRYAAGQAQFPVLSFGADATGTADSTAAIAAAQAAAVVAGGGYVVFGPGTFKTGTISIGGVTGGNLYTRPPLVHFRFAGIGATILTPTAANAPLFQVQSGKFAAGVRFEGGFTVKAHASGSTGPAIDLTSARQWVIESPSYLDSLSGAAGTPGTYAQVIGLGLNTYACRVLNPVCEGQTLGASFIGSIDRTNVVANGNSVSNPLFESCTAPYMIDAAGTQLLCISDGIIEGNTVTASVRLGYRTIVRQCWFEQGGAAGQTYAMDAHGVDGTTHGYDPGQCFLEWNDYNTTPDALTIPAGVQPGTTVAGPLGSLAITDNTNSLIILGNSATAELDNNAEGGTSGTTVTTANSGGTSGAAFNTVNGTVTFDNAQAAAPGTLSYKLVTSSSTAYVQWNVPGSVVAGTTLYLRAYVQFSGSPFNTYILTDTGQFHSVTCNGTHWTARAAAGSAVTGTTTPAAGAWYRVEAQFTYNSTAGTTVARIYNSSGTLLETLTATGGTNAATTIVAFGTPAAVTGTMWLDNLSVSDGGWLGPAVPTDQNAADIQPLGTQTAGAIGVAADAGHIHAMPRLDQVGAPTAAVGLGSQKITSLASGTISTDAAAFGQIPVTEATAAHILPAGTQAAGSNGKWADSGHAHPENAGWIPADSGWLAWNFDPALTLSQIALTNNTIFLMRVNIRAAMSITNVLFYLETVGTSLTSGQNFAGLYSSSGTLIGTTADQTSNWATTSGRYMTMPLAGGPFSVGAGFAWVAILSNGTGTMPASSFCGNNQPPAANAGAAAATARWGTAGTGTSLPGSITPSSITLTARSWWAGVS